MDEKCIKSTPPVRISLSLWTLLNDLAQADDRSLSEYIRLVLAKHAYGHAVTLKHYTEDGN